MRAPSFILYVGNRRIHSNSLSTAAVEVEELSGPEQFHQFTVAIPTMGIFIIESESICKFFGHCHAPFTAILC